MTTKEVNDLYLKVLELAETCLDKSVYGDEGFEHPEDIELPQYIGKNLDEIQEEFKDNRLILTNDDPSNKGYEIDANNCTYYFSIVNNVCVSSYMNIKRIEMTKKEVDYEDLEKIFVELTNQSLDFEFMRKVYKNWDLEQKQKYLHCLKFILFGDWPFKNKYKIKLTYFR